MRGIIKKKKSKELRNKGTLTGQNSRGKKKKKSLREKLKKEEKKVSILIWFITEKKVV